MDLKRGHTRIWHLFFAVGIMTLMWSCKPEYPEPTDRREQLNHINICVLGNSYSNDAYSYLPFILLDYGITCNIHIYYRGSGSLHDLDEQWDDRGDYGIADLDGKNHIRLHFWIDTRKQRQWKKEKGRSAHDVLEMENWDIVSLQQGGSRAKDIDSYYPYLQNVIDKIHQTCDYSFDLGWFMAYNRGWDNMNEESISTQHEIVDEFPFDIVFPVATAVFSCQEVLPFSELGDSPYKKMYASDNVHLQEGLPCYLASLTLAQAIFDKYGTGISVLGDKVRPTQEWIKGVNGITPNGTSTGVTDENCRHAQRAAVSANIHPFLIIPVE